MTSPEERAFLKQIEQHPTDVGPRLVYADWLDERNDPRGKEVRDKCKGRMPFTRGDLKHLTLDLQSLPTIPIEIDIAPSALDQFAVAAADRPRLEDDLSNISDEKIHRHFPRDHRGRLELKKTVILSAYAFAESANVPSSKNLCLAAVSPDRRKDQQVIRIQLLAGNVMNYDDGWTERRDYWDQRCPALKDSPFLLDRRLQQLAPFCDAAALQRLQAAGAKRQLSRLEKQALTLLLLDYARFEEALQMWDIFVSPEVTRMLNMEVFSLQGDGGCDCQYETAAPMRGERLRRELWQAAPWNFAEALKLHESRANARRKQQKPSELFLYIVPKQIHSRRARLTVGHGLHNQLSLDFRFAGSNVRPWRWTWTRPPEFDAGRI